MPRLVWCEPRGDAGFSSFKLGGGDGHGADGVLVLFGVDGWLGVDE